MTFENLLPPPSKPNHLPNNAQWLAGEGCGSWFHLEINHDIFLIKRYSPSGKLECAGNFVQETGERFSPEYEYNFTFLSHCAKVTIIQNEQFLQFKLIKKL